VELSHAAAGADCLATTVRAAPVASLQRDRHCKQCLH